MNNSNYITPEEIDVAVEGFFDRFKKKRNNKPEANLQESRRETGTRQRIHKSKDDIVPEQVILDVPQIVSKNKSKISNITDRVLKDTNIPEKWKNVFEVSIDGEYELTNRTSTVDIKIIHFDLNKHEDVEKGLIGPRELDDNELNKIIDQLMKNLNKAAPLYAKLLNMKSVQIEYYGDWDDGPYCIILDSKNVLSNISEIKTKMDISPILFHGSNKSELSNLIQKYIEKEVPEEYSIMIINTLRNLSRENFDRINAGKITNMVQLLLVNDEKSINVSRAIQEKDILSIIKNANGYANTIISKIIKDPKVKQIFEGYKVSYKNIKDEYYLMISK